MENQNISDLIEAYLKQILDQDRKIEIRRSEMAHQFNCVPSQINYVINTRFTLQKGYVVESKRGGGGYIRIIKIQLSNDDQILKLMKQIIGQSLSEKDSLALMQTLYEEKIISEREGNLLLAVMSKQVLQMEPEQAGQIRARMMKAFLGRLGYEIKE